MLEVRAEAKYIRTSAQKAGLVLDLIRGKKASEALSILRFTKKAVAREIEKALRSAIANAAFDLRPEAGTWRIVSEHVRPDPEMAFSPVTSKFGFFFLVRR